MNVSRSADVRAGVLKDPMAGPTSIINALSKLSAIAVLGVIGVVGVKFYWSQTQTQRTIEALETQNAEYKDVITRLGSERRMADLVVSAQSRRPDGKLETSLMMVEYTKAGEPLPPRSFTVLGERVHIDALVVKFDAQAIQKADALRGHAFLLFEKIYGDAQAPADASRIDTATEVPESLREGIDPGLSDAERRKVRDFELSLWKQFWQLSADESLRQQYGVRAAHGGGVFQAFTPGNRYTVTLQADGNITLYNEPLPELLTAAMKRPAAAGN